MTIKCNPLNLRKRVPGPEVIAVTGLLVNKVFGCPKDCLHFFTCQGNPLMSHWQIKDITLSIKKSTFLSHTEIKHKKQFCNETAAAPNLQYANFRPQNAPSV